MNKQIIKIIKKITYSIITMFLVTLLWQMLEIFSYGEVQHRAVDNIIGIILYVSICMNVNYWIEEKYIIEVIINELLNMHSKERSGKE